MGCVSSRMKEDGGGKGSSKNKLVISLKVSENDLNNRCAQKSEPKDLEPVLTDYQKDLVRKTWECAMKNIAQVGVIAFTSFFETHPSARDIFISFRDLELEELKFSSELRMHALNVTNFVEKVISRLGDNDKMVALLEDAGKKHVAHGAPHTYLQYVGPQFIKAMKPSVGDENWTLDDEKAWETLFEIIVYHMKRAMEI